MKKLTWIALFWVLGMSMLFAEESVPSKSQQFVAAKDFTLWVSVENQNSFTMNTLNLITSKIKSLSVESWWMSILLFFVFVVIAKIYPTLLGILAISHLFNDNPLAILGNVIDFLIFGVKLGASIFGLYLV